MPNQLNLLQLDKGRCFDKRSFTSFQICLLDFGASRTYGKTFVDKYIKVRVCFLFFLYALKRAYLAPVFLRR